MGVFFTEESSYTSIMHRDQTDEWRGWMMMVSITIIIIIIIIITIIIMVTIIIIIIIIMSGDPNISLHWGQRLSPHLHAHQALHLDAPLSPRVRALHLLLAEGADRDNQAGPGRYKPNQTWSRYGQVLLKFLNLFVLVKGFQLRIT